MLAVFQKLFEGGTQFDNIGLQSILLQFLSE